MFANNKGIMQKFVQIEEKKLKNENNNLLN